MKEKYYKIEIREIDAWRDEEGLWFWNESFILADDVFWNSEDFTPRKILKQLRNWNFLSPSSKGRVRVVDEGDLVEVQEKSTGRPILALLVQETIQPA